LSIKEEIILSTKDNWVF